MSTATISTPSQHRDALLRKRAELIGTGTKVLRIPIENETRHGDIADQASGNIEVDVELKIRATDAKILQAIEEALARIDKGTYGICRDCDEPIAAPRLNAIPWARTCITCKAKRD